MRILIILTVVFFISIYSLSAFNFMYGIHQVKNTNIDIEDDFELFDYKLHMSNKKIRIFIPHKSIHNNLIFLEYDLLTGQTDTINLAFKNKNIIISDNIKDFAVNSKGDFFILFENSFGRFLYDKRHNTFKKELFPLQHSYDKIRIVNNDSVLLLRHFNYFRIQAVAITLFSFSKKDIVHHITPSNDCIEFSHFGVSDLISYAEGYIAFTQSCIYKVYIYDLELNLIDSIEYNKDNWNMMDIDMLQRMRMYGYRGQDWIDNLHNYNEDISRIDGVFFLDANTLLVRYFPGGDYESNQIRKIDLWKKERDKWSLSKADMRDEIVESTLQENAPLITFGNLSVFSETYFVSLRYEVPESSNFIDNSTKKSETSNNIINENNELLKLHFYIFKRNDK